MSTRAELVSYINSNIVTNGQQAITGAMMNEILIDFTNSFLVPETDYPLSPMNGGTGIANANSRTITLGGAMTTGGSFVTTGTFSSGGNFSTSSTFAVTGALSIGAAFTTSAAVSITPAFTISGSNALVLTTSGTGTTTITFNAGTYTAAGLSLNQTFTGSNLFNGITNTFESDMVFKTGGVDFQNGLEVSTGTVIITPGLTTGNITMNDARNIITNAITGTMLCTDATQKLALWGKAPIVQPTTAISAAAFITNTSGIVDDTATFGGYTIGQIANALIRFGILQ